ncbi:MAG: YgiT-type zinc finger protein [Thermanaeromonas sp.]|uniref:YgiT-type zinc finger protein n=1 Tax=Thermanaeromonas sp. TaxID=2003697 RepID=UPI00243D7180|nr:YgiT-type zinc finger protein [Thermanaeromonas sp.]MCG0277952.1 YgiT-type zinc finger protein [Thermanaeromonas sp.]
MPSKCTCGGKLVESWGVYNEGDFFVMDVPAWKCQECGEITFKPEAMARIKEVIAEGGFYPWATVSYEELYKCFKCEELEEVKADWEIGQVIVKNVPSVKCSKCGTVGTDLKLLVELEKIIQARGFAGEVDYTEIIDTSHKKC